MKRLSPSSKLSDRELNAMLQSLREDVAAPPAFRGQVLRRLAEEGLIATAPAPAALPLGARLAAWFSLPRLGMLAGAACALALVLTTSTRVPQNVAVATVPSAAQPAAAAARPAQTFTKAAVRAKTAPAPVAEESEETFKSEANLAKAVEPAADAVMEQAPARSEALATGSAPAPQTSQALGLAAANASSSQAPAFAAHGGAAATAAPMSAAAVATAKPTVIVIEATPTPMAKALAGDSEVRNSVIRASRGESALVIFRVQQAGLVHIDIYDRLGRPVAVLKDASLAPGTYTLRWNGAADEGGMAASGIYELRIQAPGYTAKHKLGLVK